MHSSSANLDRMMMALKRHHQTVRGGIAIVQVDKLSRDLQRLRQAHRIPGQTHIASITSSNYGQLLSIRRQQGLLSARRVQRVMNEQRQGDLFNSLMQVGLVGLTGLAYLLTSLKLPQYGVIANLAAQVFWLYSAYHAWRRANQIGIFIATIVITLVLIGGVANYWLYPSKPA